MATNWAAPNLPDPKPNSPASTETADWGHLDPQLQRELARLRQDDESDAIPFEPKVGHLHHTWAQTFFSRPELYFQPASVAELRQIVTLARRCRKRICVTGFGHSPSDLTCTSSWLVNLDRLNRILETDVGGERGLVRFEAGLSLHDLNLALAADGLTLPNLGSIDVQSVAGVISTGTHGSSLRHGLISESITSLTVLLSNSQLVTCSAGKNPDLFRAALLSLGSLGVIVEVTVRAVPDFNIGWSQSLHSLASVLESWDADLWTAEEFTRVWWLPYLERAVVWRGSKTDAPARPPNTTFYGGLFGYYVYHNLLWLSNSVPRILPWIEWFVFGMQYGFRPGKFVMSAVQPAREGLLMDCLYSQFVNEWALPLAKGPEAIRRLSAWINHDDAASGIPIASKGVWVHCPVEVRVTHTARTGGGDAVRPYLDPTVPDGPTLYLNATLYRPYGRDPPCHEAYYRAFEWLMRDMGGRPHWAKNFAHTTNEEVGDMYGQDMVDFLRVRDESDPEGMFLGEWHGRTLPLQKTDSKFGLMEEEVGRKGLGGWRFGDGVLWEGRRRQKTPGNGGDDDEAPPHLKGEEQTTPSPPATATSEESFDYMAKGEASVYAE
jgi:D-arabinono-1,4-lactone oxidase